MSEVIGSTTEFMQHELSSEAIATILSAASREGDNNPLEDPEAFDSAL